MNNKAVDNENIQGRYLLFIDILGFSELVNTKGSDEVLQVITNAIEYLHRWEVLNKSFKTIYFADTFLFYQETPGYHDSFFYDIYALSGFILTALLADGVSARGAVTFGDFHVHNNIANRHQVYFGRALIEAHRAEQSENWIGITILPSAWDCFEKNNLGTVATFESEKVWQHRKTDNVLLLNPFVKMRGWFPEALMGEIDAPYMVWDPPEFPNEIRAFCYLQKQIKHFISVGDFTGRISSKYFSTDAFLRNVFGSEMYEWACDICTKIELEGDVT